MNTEGNLIINTGFKEHDQIQSKIDKFNFTKGLKSIMQGAWTYDKLAKNAAKKLNVSFEHAYRLGIDELIEHA